MQSALAQMQPADAPAALAADPPLALSIVTTATLPCAQQFEFWCERNRPVMDLRRPADAAPGFAITNSVWPIGDAVLSRVTGPALDSARTPASLRRAPVDHWALGLSRRGTTITETRRGTCIAGPGTPFVYSLGETYVSRRTDIDWLVLFLPRDGFAGIADALDAVSGSALTTPMGQLLADYLLSLERRLPQIGRSALPGLLRATEALIGACVAPTRDRLAAAAPAASVARLERIRRDIRTHLVDADISPGQLARRVGMSRSALYRLLEHEGGVARFVQRQRLQAARALLMDPECTLAIQQIAERVGIPDAATFSRAFRARFGCAPRDMRAGSARGRACQTPPAPAPCGPGASFWSLLHPRDGRS